MLRRLSSPAAARAQVGLFALLVLLWVFLGPIQTAHATLLVHEPFDYDDGTLLDGVTATGQNLRTYAPLGPAPEQRLAVRSPGLRYGNLQNTPLVSGNRVSDDLGVTAAGATVELETPISTGPGQTLYWSSLFVFDDSGNANDLANIRFRDDETQETLFFGEPAVGSRAVRVATETIATGELVAAGADNAFDDGSTLLLIGRYINSALAGGDALELIGYDTAGRVEIPGTFDPEDPRARFAFQLLDLDVDFEQITSIDFTIRGGGNNFIDELRIGTRYGAVIPEPEPLVLVLVGLSALALFPVGDRERRRDPRSCAQGVARWVTRSSTRSR